MRETNRTCAEGTKLIYAYDGRLRTYLLKMEYICHEARGKPHCYCGLQSARSVGNKTDKVYYDLGLTKFEIILLNSHVGTLLSF